MPEGAENDAQHYPFFRKCQFDVKHSLRENSNKLPISVEQKRDWHHKSVNESRYKRGSHFSLLKKCHVEVARLLQVLCFSGTLSDG